MAVERCDRCDRFVDESDVTYIDLTPICFDCLTDEEADKEEREFNGGNNRDFSPEQLAIIARIEQEEGDRRQ